MATSNNYKIKQMSPQLLAADINRSIEFYTKKLGFNIDFRYEDFYAGVIKDGFSIHLKTGKPAMNEFKNKKNYEILEIIFSVVDTASPISYIIANNKTVE